MSKSTTAANPAWSLRRAILADAILLAALWGVSVSASPQREGTSATQTRDGRLSQAENDWFIYLGDKAPSKAPPKQINAAEALPPLPLPATPLRRTERKKPPQPDTLVGKVIWGESASFTDSDGGEMQIADWNLCPTDVQRLLEKVRETGLSYHWTSVNLNDFQLDPKTMPALLFSGTRTLRLSGAHIAALRSYVLNGGMVVGDSIAGSPYFYESARNVFQQAFPECRWRVIPADHPLYHMFMDVTRVSCPGHAAVTEPLLEGIYVGSRAGVLLSRYGLGCGWNRDLDRLGRLPQAVYYDTKSATEIGVNLTAYIIGYAEAGGVEARPEIYGTADRRPPTDEFVFAQLKHDGAWNVHPGAATNLLTKLRRHTTIRVNLKRVVVDPETDDLAGYAFLYLTGLDEFSFSARAISALQQFLRSGGFLLANNGLGLSTFDQAVRRELARVAPEAGLQLLPLGHGLYNSLFKIEQVGYSSGLAQADPSLAGRPQLWGMVVGGDLRIVYSPYDLEAGWLPARYPLMKGYDSASAERLGMNIIVHIMTH